MARSVSRRHTGCLMQDLSRSDIHRIGIPHEEKYGGILWAHLLHYHVSKDTAICTLLCKLRCPK